MKHVCLWSGPRNVSTALMYSFAQRGDTVVVDEPLYGHYLRVSGAEHPGRDEVLAAMDCDGDAVMGDLLDDGFAPDTELVFMKQMAHHLVDIDLSFLRRTENVLLIRDPDDMLPSLAVQLPDARLADTGLATQWQLYSDLEQQDRRPVVIDSRELLLDPEAVLAELCRRLGISFEPAMLSWPAGSRKEDGVWARHWYHAVHQSTGFQTYRAKTDFPPSLLPLLQECRPYYERLYEQAIRSNRS